MNDPDVSVIIPTIGEAARLERTIRSILACEGPPFEVIVVDQRGDDVLAECVAGMGDERVRHVRRKRKGRNGAMNHGARAARGEILAFTDDDIIVHKDWLRAAHEAFQGPDCPHGVVGRILQFGDPPSPEHMAPQTADWPEACLLTSRNLWKGFGANTFYRRSVFEKLGGYDARMGVGGPVGGSGDWDLLYRVVAGGHRVLYSPALVVWHDGWETLEQRSRKALCYDRARCACHVKCWFEVGGPALWDMAALTARTFFNGVGHLAHRRRGTAWACFKKFGHYMSGVPLGVRLALGRRNLNGDG